jgi:hypothetical protein
VRRLTAAGFGILIVFSRALHFLPFTVMASDPRPLFGLGAATAYDRIEVTWPDGTREAFPGGPADRWVSLTPGSGHKVTM